MAADIETKATQMATDTVDPIDLQMQLYQQQSFLQIETAQASYNGYLDHLKVVDEARDAYFNTKDVAVKSNLRVEESLLSLEKGEIDGEEMQKTS